MKNTKRQSEKISTGINFKEGLRDLSQPTEELAKIIEQRKQIVAKINEPGFGSCYHCGGLIWPCGKCGDCGRSKVV